MLIKPLEKNNNRGLALKISFLVFLTATGFLINKFIPRTSSSKIRENILGTETDKFPKIPVEEAEKFIKQTTDNLVNDTVDAVNSFASQSAEAVTDTVFTSTVVNVVKQIDKLSPKQQEEIKNVICR